MRPFTILVCDASPLTMSRCCAAVYNTLLDICVRTKDDERGYEIIDRMCACRSSISILAVHRTLPLQSNVNHTHRLLAHHAVQEHGADRRCVLPW